MLPYTIIKEVHSDDVRGSATGAINFLVFTLSALLTPAYSNVLAYVANGGAMNLVVFRAASMWLIGCIVLAIVLAPFLCETGSQARAAA